MKIVVALLAALIAAGAAPPEPGGVHARSSPPASNDSALEQRIRARFAKSKIAADNFQVRVQGGVATIEGRTSIVQRKGVATRLARSAGAKKVVNRIQISEEARRNAAASLEKTRAPELGRPENIKKAVVRPAAP